MPRSRPDPRDRAIAAAPPSDPGVEEVGPESTLEVDSLGEIVRRPDGYHWIAPDGRQEFGPFASYEETCAYRDRLDEAAPAPENDELLEVEEDIGIADWVDPDTGELAEGQCPPHLSDD